ncbi:hypothetical protein GVAV_000087 [Gurleya vavrai]
MKGRAGKKIKIRDLNLILKDILNVQISVKANQYKKNTEKKQWNCSKVRKKMFKRNDFKDNIIKSKEQNNFYYKILHCCLKKIKKNGLFKFYMKKYIKTAEHHEIFQITLKNSYRQKKVIKCIFHKPKISNNTKNVNKKKDLKINKSSLQYKLSQQIDSNIDRIKIEDLKRTKDIIEILDRNVSQNTPNESGFDKENNTCFKRNDKDTLDERSSSFENNYNKTP